MYVLCPEYALGAHGTFLPDVLALAGYAPAAGSSLSPNHRSIDGTLLRSETQGRAAPCPAAAIPGRAGGPTDDGPTSAGVVARDKGRGAGASQSQALTTAACTALIGPSARWMEHVDSLHPRQTSHRAPPKMRPPHHLPART